MDTGPSNQRAVLERKLGHAGCQPGNLNLIVATHGDSDHVGNCVYLRQAYVTKIAMHPAEVEAVKKGNATLNKKIPDTLLGSLTKSIVHLFPLEPTDRFEPDLLLEDVVGLIASDGCLQRDGRVVLTSKDHDLLETFVKIVGAEVTPRARSGGFGVTTEDVWIKLYARPDCPHLARKRAKYDEFLNRTMQVTEK